MGDFGTLSFGGWLGGFLSASVQAVLLWNAMRDRRLSVLLAITYFGAAMLRSLLFYYDFLFATSSDPHHLPPPVETMLVVALIVWFSAKLAEATTANPGMS